MKKLLVILLVVSMASTFAFAKPGNRPGDPGTGGHGGFGNGGSGNGGSETVTDDPLSFYGPDNAPDMNITLKSTLDPTPYDLSMYYGETDFTGSENYVIDGLDLTTAGSTDNFFYVKISNGNLNSDITFETTVTANPFEGVVNGDLKETNNDLSVKGSDGNVNYTFSKTVSAGPNNMQNIAVFKYYWTGDDNLAAGDYKTENTISVTVE